MAKNEENANCKHQKTGCNCCQKAETYTLEEANIVSILHDTQQRYNYLPKEELIKIGEQLKIPLSHVYRIATFYKAFHLNPGGEHTIKVCTGTACHVKGSAKILEKLEEKLEIKSGETTKDKKISIETVGCLGTCALAPITVLDNGYHGKMNTAKIEKIIKEIYNQK